ncbi:MAG: hypothetical protein QNJ14_15220 [Woeseiaceae bacterium]|nr:hypothetical protein [Woeseiaceae bacterium]
MFKTLALIATAIVLTGCAGNSTQTASSEEGAVAAAESSKPKMKCKYVKTTTSRLGEKVCKKVSD